MNQQQEKKEIRRELMSLISGVTSDTIRTYGIQALSTLRKRERATHATAADPVDERALGVFQLNALGTEIVSLLKPGHPRAQELGNEFVEDETMGRSWMSKVLEFLWWLMRAGLAVESRRTVMPTQAFGGSPHAHQTDRFPIQIRLTERGLRFLDGEMDNNPMLPGFLDRIGGRCPGIPEGVIALLVDARACFDHSLMRPAVVLVGVAYELVIEKVVETLIDKHFLELVKREETKDRIKRIAALFNTEAAKRACPKADTRSLAEDAYRFAEQLRQRRNDAAHTKPSFDFTHKQETEEYFVSAGRYLPAIWSPATWETLQQ